MAEETAGTPLTYSEYINDRAVIEALQMPPCPAGVDPSRWPHTHAPGARPAGPGSVEWEPGDRWPRGGVWSHDEVLFIRTHQAFEVWFAQAIHEIESALTDAIEVWQDAGAAIPRVSLEERPLSEDPGEAFDAEAFPNLSAAIERCAERFGPRVRAAAELIGTPGRIHEPATLKHSDASDDLFTGRMQRMAQRLERATAVLLVTVPFFDVLATMTPGQFLAFRDRLQPASGFGSAQFRVLELLLGLREINERKLRPTGGSADADLPAGMLRPTGETPVYQQGTSFASSLAPWAWERVASTYAATSLRDLVYQVLNVVWEWRGRWVGAPALPQQRLDALLAVNFEKSLEDWHRGLADGSQDEGELDDTMREWSQSVAQREPLAAALIEMDYEHLAVARFLSAALALDEALLRWRDRHIRFVERMIGTRRGTGGGGIRYLRRTTSAELGLSRTHALPCLWQARGLTQRWQG